MGAITVNTAVVETANGHQIQVQGSLTFSDSYATGGDTFTAAQFGLTVLDRLYVFPPVADTPGTTTILPVGNVGAGTVQAFTAGGTTGGTHPLAEVTAAEDLSALGDCQYMAYGV